MKKIGILFCLATLFLPLTGLAKNDGKSFRKVAPAVAVIIGQEKAGSKRINMGAGTIITPDGHLLTNAHVVMMEKNRPYPILKAYLQLDNDEVANLKDLQHPYTLTCNNWQPDLDLALCKIESRAAINFPYAVFSSTEEVDIGTNVIAIGHPEGGACWTMTSGTISAQIKNKDNIRGKDVFQTETSFNRGNSGGPLVNEFGKVVGINCEMARLGSGGIAITAVNFALKAPVITNWLKSLGLNIDTE